MHWRKSNMLGEIILDSIHVSGEDVFRSPRVAALATGPISAGERVVGILATGVPQNASISHCQKLLMGRNEIKNHSRLER
jgi:hypothetical protein